MIQKKKLEDHVIITKTYLMIPMTIEYGQEKLMDHITLQLQREKEEI